MKHILSIVAVVMAGVLQAVEIDFSQYRNLYGFSLNGYSNGQDLSNLGAQGGTWGLEPIPEGAIAKTQIGGGETNLVVDTRDAIDDLVFKFNRYVRTATTTYMRFKATFQEADELPILDSEVKAAFCVCNIDGSRSFFGYTSEGWLRLRSISGGLHAEFDRSYDFMIGIDKGKVAYYVKNSNDQWEQFAEDGGARDTFSIGGSGDSINRVEFSGNGALSDFDGCYQCSGVTLRVRK